MDESHVSDENTVDGDVATGGKVWSPPLAPNSSVPLPFTRRERIMNSYREAWGNPAFMATGLILFMVTLPFVFALFVFFYDTSENHNFQWEQEYGYQKVIFNNEETIAVVTTSTQETIPVDALTYKGAKILFESQEQLYEKIEEVENGTYPEELYQP